ncbi:coiled-coil domain-containing glutamate-rich protein 1 [Coregonus clupeaformis]|uniref:coiled-coil domain-containing glutamate-rich protein 1 n=1 Tax=Coregonus clupeaformis TaxID=59861 RepID=UPI001BE0B7C0|nr:coiled-coil domain-containing glutamate-rich protein 1 [Coregonus clupeaformis]
MLFEQDMFRKGTTTCQRRVCSDRSGCKYQQKEGQPARRGDNSKLSWPKNGRRQQGYRGKRGRVHGPLHHHHPHHPRQFYRQNRPTQRPPRLMTSLRPVNIKGNRAPGMRAPRNTNQFLMHEKYQMMHMRSDSVGTDSGSDCETDSTDMDSYLGVLENARGALLDSPDLTTTPARFFPRELAKCQQLPFFSLEDLYQEEQESNSMQYFPSENDVMQSEDFMQKDFNDFCDTFSGTEPPIDL